MTTVEATAPPLATVEQFAVWLRSTTDAIDTARATLMLDAASHAIRRWTHQYLTLVEGDQVVLDPSQGRFLWLDQLPVVSVASVSVHGTALAAGDFAFDGKTGRLWRTDHREWFGRPSGIAVTYSHGYETIPGDLVAVCCGMAERGYSTEPGDQALIGETLDGYSYQRSWQVAVSGVAGLTTAEQQALQDYRVRPQHPVPSDEWWGWRW